MTKLPSTCSIHTRFHRQGWLYSVMFHVFVAVCTLLLASQLTLSSETDSFQWNVALMESSSLQPTIDPVAEIHPDPPPPAPSPTKSRPTSRETRTKPVRPQIAQQQVTQANQEVAEVIPVNHTASTVLAPADEPHQDSPERETATTEQQFVEEEPEPATQTASSEAVTPAVASLMSQPNTVSVDHHPIRETANETSANIQPLGTEQLMASATPVRTAPAGKPDYDWLMKALLGRVNELKNYPVMARMNRWEGKVVLRAVIREDGQVLMVDVQESSGRSILDNDAMETLKKASPLKLDHPLGKPQVAILMPISYSLR
jgi:periplasmic protein TonB